VTNYDNPVSVLPDQVPALQRTRGVASGQSPKRPNTSKEPQDWDGLLAGPFSERKSRPPLASIPKDVEHFHL
jgi:hypothetical protein